LKRRRLLVGRVAVDARVGFIGRRIDFIGRTVE
jgi:hypothetical protein